MQLDSTSHLCNLLRHPCIHRHASPKYSPKHRSARVTHEELKPLRSFRCRDACAFKPSDKADVLAAIRRGWGSEEAFDLFVQTELVQAPSSTA